MLRLLSPKGTRCANAPLRSARNDKRCFYTFGMLPDNRGYLAVWEFSSFFTGSDSAFNAVSSSYGFGSSDVDFGGDFDGGLGEGDSHHSPEINFLLVRLTKLLNQILLKSLVMLLLNHLAFQQIALEFYQLMMNRFHQNAD